MKRFSKLAREADVLVAHPPPYGFIDLVAGRLHAGGKALVRIVEKYRPTLVLYGHIHEWAGVADTNGTIVVNCAMGRSCNGAMIDMEKGQHPSVRMI